MVNSVVIVLGATSTSEAKPTPSMRRRTVSGCKRAQDIPNADLLLCGGATNVHHGVSEAAIMAQLAKDSGVETTHIFLEDQSRNTMENAVFAKVWIKRELWDDIHVVTDRWHILRAKFVFKAFGVKAKFHVADGEPKAGVKQFSAMLYEVPALLWYGLRILRADHKKYQK